MTDTAHDLTNKQAVFANLAGLCSVDADRLANAASTAYAADAQLRASCPIDEANGVADIVARFWRPLRKALPDAERRVLICAAGPFEGRRYVAMMGFYQGTFEHDLFDIPATHGVVHLRFGEIHEVDGGRIVRSHALVDFLNLMAQANCWPLVPSLGAEGMWPGPADMTGVQLDCVDPVAGQAAIEPVLGMHRALFAFDGKNIESMDHAQYWTPDFMWYGPAGIGTTRGMAGFRAHHQVPFLRAFPDRKGAERTALLGDGNLVVTGGWPSVAGTHTGGDWLGIAPTGKRVGMRVMDFYRIENGLIAENWVPIDVIDILRQLGVNVFDRVRHRRGKPRMSL